MRASANGYQATGPDGRVHTMLTVMIHRVEFVKKPRGPEVVRVLMTIGESEDSTGAVPIEMTYEQALAADIIERVE